MEATSSQKQIQEFKEAFDIMDVDKDGIISTDDLCAAFTNIGRSMSEGATCWPRPPAVNFTQLNCHTFRQEDGGR